MSTIKVVRCNKGATGIIDYVGYVLDTDCWTTHTLNNSSGIFSSLTRNGIIRRVPTPYNIKEALLADRAAFVARRHDAARLIQRRWRETISNPKMLRV
jgi:hypothetical protein